MTDRQNEDGQTYRQIGRQANSKSDRQTDSESGTQAGIQTVRQTEDVYKRITVPLYSHKPVDSLKAFTFSSVLCLSDIPERTKLSSYRLL